MLRSLSLMVVVAGGLLVVATAAQAAELAVEKSDRGVTVRIDGQLFTEYLIQSGPKPILWPVIGPTGKPMTRSYPMKKVAGEKEDHVHHRSLWFTHGSVNGVDFWAEGVKSGQTVHREFLKVEGGARATIATRNDWIGPDGKKVCEDVRTVVLGGDRESRWIDYEIVVKATEGPVKFGDTKEGSFGIRVADSMSVDRKRGGRIINSKGQSDDAAWGKPAAWVDYSGPVEGENLGIAILNHPSSFRYPTCWHVRTYGLFAANPFGLRDFQGSEKVDGSHTIPAGQSMTLRYRILLHKGDEKAGKVAEAFASYAKEKR
ncbi:MAG: DUF6807 domain-containing protein [Pirellulales bacterium]